MTDNWEKMRLKHIIEAQQFNKKLIVDIFEETRVMKSIVEKKGCIDLLKTKIMASLFYTISTRTRLSFESAMLRLGGAVMNTEHPDILSSESKGGTLEDMIQIVNEYADVIVLRHFETGSAQRAAAVSQVPIINAGDGSGQHPTQALLDLYTIHEEVGGIDGISIVMVGDLANGRTIRSLCYFLAHYSGIRIYFISPRFLKMKEDILNYLRENGIWYSELTNIKDALMNISSKVDVIYQTQIPRSVFGERIEDYSIAKKYLVVNKRLLQRMKKDAIIMHPFPRAEELSLEVDRDRRAVYFNQTKNGLYVRMALLKMVLSEGGGSLHGETFK